MANRLADLPMPEEVAPEQQEGEMIDLAMVTDEELIMEVQRRGLQIPPPEAAPAEAAPV